MDLIFRHREIPHGNNEVFVLLAMWQESARVWVTIQTKVVGEFSQGIFQDLVIPGFFKNERGQFTVYAISNLPEVTDLLAASVDASNSMSRIKFQGVLLTANNGIGIELHRGIITGLNGGN